MSGDTYGLALQNAGQQGEDVGGRLSGACLGLAEHILSLQGQWDGLALHEGGLLEALLCDGLHQARVETELGERRFSFWLFLLGLASLARFGLGFRRRRCGLVVLVQFALHGGCCVRDLFCWSWNRQSIFRSLPQSADQRGFRPEEIFWDFQVAQLVIGNKIRI